MLKLGRKNPTQERSRITVDSIFEAVARILDREGPLALTTNKIAEVAGVSVGSLYQYFKNKESIFEALLLKQTEKNLEDLERALNLRDRSEIKLRDLVESVVSTHFESFEKMGKLSSLLFQYAPQILPASHFKKADERIIAFVRSKFDEYGIEIASPQREDALFVCIQAMRSVIFMSFVNRTKDDRVKIRQELANMLYRYLEPVSNSSLNHVS